jgi:uncharacterized protein
MEILYKYHQQYLANYQESYRRDDMDLIPWEEQLVGIKGAKGVGKTTLMLQKILEDFGRSAQALYISMDSMAMKDYTITDIVEYHRNNGGTHLFIDEIHKHNEWSRDLKTAYDLYSDVHIVFTGSSMLQIYKGQADLSRRAVMHTMQGLSFREYIWWETGEKFSAINLEDLLRNHIDLANEITSKVKIQPLFQQYLKAGYYPFYKKNKKTFYLKVQNVINNTLEVDMPFVLGTNVQNVQKIKRLLHMLATEVPFQPNIARLCNNLDLNKATINSYIHYLSEAGLINLLNEAGKGYSLLTKPEKIYLNNTNLSYCIDELSIDKGALRELFFFNQLALNNKVHVSSKGDFMVNEKFIFEIGGKNKTFSQIADVKNSYLVTDEIITGLKNKIPLWIFGFMY